MCSILIILRFKDNELNLIIMLKRTFLLLSLSIMLLPSCDKATPNDITEREDIILTKTETAITADINSFAFDLYKGLGKVEQKEFFISPLSASLALSMTSNGAAGTTQSQMREVLGFSEYSQEEMNQFYKKITDALLKVDPSTTIAIANSIWADNSLKLNTDFVSMSSRYYNALVKNVDFGNSNAVVQINKWCADNTGNKITKVIDQIDHRAKAFLLNALYFKGIWKAKFDKNMTEEASFTTFTGEKKNLPLMNRQGSFGYTENKTFQVAELPYGNEAFSLVILLPKENVPYSEAVSSLSSESWNRINESIYFDNLDIFIPRIDLEYEIKLNDILKSLGMTDAFDPNMADFMNMSDTPLFIDFVKQNTFLKLNEEGTEAAAVTVVGMKDNAVGPVEYISFRADRPFIYMIKEKSTGIILFMGQKG